MYARAEGDATTVGIVAVAQLLPAAVLAPTLATRLDRLPKRIVLPVTYGLIALALAATAVAMMLEASLPVVVAWAALATVLIGMGRPAHHSVTPLLVDNPGDLVASNVVTTSAEGFGLFIGPALVGLVMGVAGPAEAVLVTVAAMAVAAVWGSRLPVPDRLALHHSPAPHDAHSHQGDNPGGASYPVALGGAAGIVEGATDVLIVLLAIDVLGLGDSGAGYINALVGVGAVAGSLVASSLVGRSHLAPALLGGVAAIGGSMVLVGLAPGTAWFLGVMGVGASVAAVATRTLLQRATAIPVMARAFGRLEGATLLGIGLGAVSAPFVSETVGVPAAFVAFGLLLPVLAAAMWPGLRRTDASGAMPSATLAALRRVELVAGLSPEAQEALARAAELITVAGGTVIVREGEAGNEMFVIDQGTVRVSHEGQDIAVLGVGDLFGEIAVLSGGARIATVTAAEPAVLVSVGRQAVMAALSTDPDTRLAVERLASARRTETLG